MDVLKFALAGRMRSCLALVGCGALAVLAAAPVSAQPFDPDPNSILRNSQSIESETTFDLFENEYDYALMPSYMGFFEDAGRIYTQLGNIGGEDMFQFMHYRPLGPGYLSFRVLYTSGEFETTSSQRFEDFVDDATPNDGNVDSVPDIVSDAETEEDESEEIDLYVGYAWPITENGSLGFGLDYSNSTIEDNEDTQTNIDDPRGPLGDDRTRTDVQTFKEESEYITLIAEYMHRGDTSWRVRGFVSDVDNTIEDNQDINELIIVDNPDEEGGPSCGFDESCETNDVSRSSGEYLFDSFAEGGTPGSFNFLNRVGHDGVAYGIEGELRWEKNPKIHHQANVGLSTGDFDPKEDSLQQSTSTFTGIDDPALVPDTFIQTFTDNHVITDSDISSDSQFVTWKTRGHFGDTHVAVGLYWFNSETELEITADSINTFNFQELDGGAVTYAVTYGSDSFFTATAENQLQTFSIPLALEQDVTGRVQVRLGAQFIQANLNSEWTDVDTQERFFSTVDADGDGSGAPVTTFSPDDRFRETHTLEFDDTISEVLYHAGIAVEWDRVVLEVLLADSSGGNSDRDGIDLDTAFVGATFKLAAKN